MTTKIKRTGYIIFINENKKDVINKLKREKTNETLYGHEILNELSKVWNELSENEKENYKNIAKYIEEEPEWLINAENIINKQFNFTFDISYKHLYNM